MSAKIDVKAAPFERRYLVSRMGNAGTFREQGRVFRIWEYMTFHVDGAPAIAAKFEGLAPIDEQGFLRLEHIREGLIVVKPGLLYRKVAMTGQIMAEHLKAMKGWRKPAPLLAYEVDKAAGVTDLGAIDFSGQTKQ